MDDAIAVGGGPGNLRRIFAMLALKLDLLPGSYSIVRLPPECPVPDWAFGEGCVSVTMVDDELSIVCRTERVPPAVEGSDNWAAIKVDTKFDLDAPGVVLSAVRPVSEAGLGIFVISTFYRDYILVRQSELTRVVALQRQAGHEVTGYAGDA